MSNRTELAKEMFYKAAYACQTIETRKAICNLPQDIANSGVFYMDYVHKYVSLGEYDKARCTIEEFKEAILVELKKVSNELDRNEALRNTLLNIDE